MKGKVKKVIAGVASVLVISFLIIIGCRKKAINDYNLGNIMSED